MWKQIDNNASVISLYKETLPRFQNIHVQDLSVITGQDIELDIRFDTGELPNPLPRKWEEMNVNTIQFAIGCTGVRFRHFDINDNFSDNQRLSIEVTDSTKILTIWKSNGDIGLQVETPYVFVKSVSGYCSTLRSRD